jgi:hypothetical protein
MSKVLTEKNGGEMKSIDHTLDRLEFVKNDRRHANEHGLNWWVTGLFVVGEMAGGGIVSLPTAIVHAGM